LTHKRVSIAVFRAANNWPVYAAVGNEILEQAGVEVEVVHISSSMQQMKGLICNEYEIIHTAADNVIAAWVGNGLAVPAERKPRIFMGGDDGFLSVHSSSNVKSFGDLQGKRVGFDSATSGFAFVLKKILSVEGLKEGAYREVVVGGTDLRYKALVEGSIDAAIMTPPHDFLCSTGGFTKLADASEYLPRYQGLVGVCCPDSLPMTFLKEYKAALVKSLLWLRDRRNKTAAIDILEDYLEVGGDNSLFVGLYDALISREQGGFDWSGNVDYQALDSVVMLRREFSRTTELGPPSEYLMQL
jgi:ABC-type nitrate/sulfonate/bicarbonate transport system substrate-binding protein